MNKYILTKIIKENKGYFIKTYRKEELLYELKLYLEDKYRENEFEYFRVAIRKLDLIIKNRYVGINEEIFKNKNEIINFFYDNKEYNEIFAFVDINILKNREIDKRLIFENVGLCICFCE